MMSYGPPPLSGQLPTHNPAPVLPGPEVCSEIENQFRASPQDDTIILNLEDASLIVNGTKHLLNPEFRQVDIMALAGTDRIVCRGSRYPETVLMQSQSLQIFSRHYDFTIRGVDEAEFDAGNDSQDFVILYDSPADDLLWASRGEIILANYEYELRAINVVQTMVFSKDGTDRALLKGSEFDDQVLIDMEQRAVLFEAVVNDQPRFVIDANGFAELDVDGTGSGADEARILDSFGPDTYQAETNSSTFSNSHLHYQIDHFESVHALAIRGGVDRAILVDIPPSNFSSQPNFSVLRGNGYENIVRGFEDLVIQPKGTRN